MSVRRRAASVSRNQSCHRGPLSPTPHCSVDHRGLLTSAWPHSDSNAAGSLKTQKTPTITAGLFNAKSRLTSLAPLGPLAFCGQKEDLVDVSWSHLFTANDVEWYWCYSSCEASANSFLLGSAECHIQTKKLQLPQFSPNILCAACILLCFAA